MQGHGTGAYTGSLRLGHFRGAGIIHCIAGLKHSRTLGLQGIESAFLDIVGDWHYPKVSTPFPMGTILVILFSEAIGKFQIENL